jgi:transcriptional regulator with XRE-family HTH domain
MPKVTVNSIGDYIREQREQAKISMRQLAQSAGVSNPYLSQIERGLRKPSADILQQIAKGLRISAEALYVQAGILEDRPADSGVRSALLTDPELSERQKQVLIEIYESFRRENLAASESARAEAVAAELIRGESDLSESDLSESDLSESDLSESDLGDGAPGAEEAFLAAAAEAAVADAQVAEAEVIDAEVADTEAALAEAAKAAGPDALASESADASHPDDALDQPGLSAQAEPPITPNSASD